MADDPSWDEIFGAPATDRTPATPERHAAAPTVGVAAAADEARRTSPVGVIAPPPAGARRAAREDRPRRPRRRFRWGLLVFFIGFLIAVVVAGVLVWNTYGERIQQVLGVAEPIDYDGAGNGEPVTVVIQLGDIGEDVARTLVEQQVTKTFQAFYQLLLADATIAFEPGNYQLQQHMSAAAALEALQDPENKIINTVQIPEGSRADSALVLLAAATGLPDTDFQAAAQDLAALGIPAEAGSIEGWLFPATYTFDPGITAPAALKTMVDRMIQELDSIGVPPERRIDTLKLASIVQRESGPNLDDMGKIARVFQNRLDQGMKLESDATVAYGTGNYDTVFTTAAERADASNPYNTYANAGLPAGPIGLPRAAAIEAAANPPAGDWLFFVTVDLKTGETQFSTSADEHEAGVAKLRAWCATAEAEGYC